MAIALVSSGVGNQSATSSAVTLNTVGANLLVASVAMYESKSGFTLTDSQGNTWTALTERHSTGTSRPQVQQFYCLNPTTNASHTITAAATDLYGTVYVHAFSGVDAYNAENGGNSLSDSSLATGTITPPSDGSVLIAVGAIGGTSTETGAGTYTGFTQAAFSAGVSIGLTVSYYIQTTAAAVGETFSGSTVARAASQCCFTAAIATGQPASRRMGGVKFAGNQSLGMNRW